MNHTRILSILLTAVSIALTWLFLAGFRKAAELLTALGGQLGAELLLPARVIQPTATVFLAALASAGTVLLVLIQLGNLRDETRLLLLCTYLCLLAICVLIAFAVTMLQIHLLFLAPQMPIVAL